MEKGSRIETLTINALDYVFAEQQAKKLGVSTNAFLGYALKRGVEHLQLLEEITADTRKKRQPSAPQALQSPAKPPAPAVFPPKTTPKGALTRAELDEIVTEVLYRLHGETKK